MLSRLLAFWLFMVLLVSCTMDNAAVMPMGNDQEPIVHYEVPQGFTPMDIPANNMPTASRLGLGRDLFYDPILSLDSTKSCSSCHNPDLAFADSTPLSVGVRQRLGERNAPSLANIGFHNSFFLDGGVPTLEQVTIAPLENELELALPHQIAVSRLNRNEKRL